MKSQKDSGFVGVLILVLLIIVGLCLLPLLLVIMLFGAIYNVIMPTRKKNEVPPWINIPTNSEINIQYKLGDFDNLPEFLQEYFEERGLFVYETDPNIDFFEGYFTDFKVERSDGIFVQKVIFDEINQVIQSAPLFFFKYKTQELEEIKDLRDYEIDSKGNPDDFMISAYGEDENFEIRLTK